VRRRGVCDPGCAHVYGQYCVCIRSLKGLKAGACKSVLIDTPLCLLAISAKCCTTDREKRAVFCRKQTAATSLSAHLSSSPRLSTLEPCVTQDDKETLSFLRQGVIGSDATCLTPFGRKQLVSADWAASGRLMTCMEAFITAQVAPWYANVHTDAGACARHTSALYEEARSCVAESVGAPPCDYSVIFAGSGMTAAAFKLAHLLGLTAPAVSATGRPVVMYSIMEHHSNCLLWRELDVDTVVRFWSLDSFPVPKQVSIFKLSVTFQLWSISGALSHALFSAAELLHGLQVIQEDAHGLPDLNQLERELQYHSSAGVCPFILSCVADSPLR
jgi:hypothetical protein